MIDDILSKLTRIQTEEEFVDNCKFGNVLYLLTTSSGFGIIEPLIFKAKRTYDSSREPRTVICEFFNTSKKMRNVSLTRTIYFSILDDGYSLWRMKD